MELFPGCFVMTVTETKNLTDRAFSESATGPASFLNGCCRFDFTDLFCITFFSARLYNFVASRFIGLWAAKYVMLAFSVLALCALVQGLARRVSRSRLLVFISCGMVMGLLAVISLWRNPGLDYWMWKSDWALTWFVADVRKGIWGMLAVGACRDFKVLWRNLKIAAWIAFAYLMVQTSLFMANGNWSDFYNTYSSTLRYNMVYGYELWFCASVFLAEGLYRGRLIYSLAGGFAAGLAINYGSRGVILCLLAFFGLWGVFSLLRPSRKQINVKTAVNLLAVFVMIFVAVTVAPYAEDAVFDYVHRTDPVVTDQQEKESVHGESRTLQMLKGGSITESNGRGRIARLSQQAFKDHQIIGSGLFADRKYVGLEYEWGYSHNLIFEVMAQFGFVGLAALGVLGLFSLRAFWKSRDEAAMTLAVFAASAAKLLVSDSYLFLNFFWAFLVLLCWDAKLRAAFCTALVTVVGAAVAVVLYLPVARDRLSYRAVAFNRPAVLIYVGGQFSRSAEQAVLYLHSQGVKGTYFMCCVDTSSEFLARLDELKKAGWSFQDGSYDYSSPKKQSYNDFERSLGQVDQFFALHGLPEPIAYLPPFGAWSDVVSWRLGDRRRLVFDYTSDYRSSRTYKILTDSVARKITGYRAWWTSKSGYYAFRALFGRGTEAGGNLVPLFVDSSLWRPAHLKQLVKDLKAWGFEFVTVDELQRRRELVGRPTWHDLWEQSYLIDALRSLF